MNRHKWVVYASWTVLAEAVGGLSGWLTREGARQYSQSIRQPPLSPPPLAFPIVWAGLFALMGVGAARVYLSAPSPERSRALTVFFVQLGFNFFWSILFFNFQAFGAALVWLAILWLLIIWMIVEFAKVDKTAAWLQVPYLLWVSFAAYLNAGVWRLN